METKRLPLQIKNKEKGAVLVLIAFLLVLFVAIAALSIDIGHLYVVRNELQNAADAGALNGANYLYVGSAVNTGANGEAATAATKNQSEHAVVELYYNAANNTGDVQRGHWSFATRKFTANDSIAAYDFTGVTPDMLDADTNYINAVKVKVRRQNAPAAAFFAQIFGYANFAVTAEAIGYIGFAGPLAPGEVDQPIAICQDSIQNADGSLSCNIGRMINSGSNETNNETGGWTDFNQDDPCSGGTNASIMDSLICSGGNPNSINLLQPMATNGGQITSAFNSLKSCWSAATSMTSSWNVTLPIINCPGNNITTCQNFVGAVNVDIVWITGAGEDPGYNNVPTQMDDWSDDGLIDHNGDGVIDGEDKWADFVDHFNLKNVDGSDAPYQKKAIYFKPNCTFQVPVGTTGGTFSNVPADRAVLVN